MKQLSYINRYGRASFYFSIPEWQLYRQFGMCTSSQLPLGRKQAIVCTELTLDMKGLADSFPGRDTLKERK